MPVSYEFDGNVVRFTCDGELSNPIVREALEAATKEAVFTPGMSILLHDLGSDYRISSDEAYEAARDLNDLMGLYSPHIAVVVSEDIKYGLGRMIAAYCERHGIDFQVFRNFDNARQWLEYVREPGDGGSGEAAPGDTARP
jgi:hypothetical protein